MGRENREISSPSLGQLCSKDAIPKSGWEPLLSAPFLSPHAPKPHDSFKAQLQAPFSPSPGESSGQEAEDSDPGPGQSAQGRLSINHLQRRRALRLPGHAHLSQPQHSLEGEAGDGVSETNGDTRRDQAALGPSGFALRLRGSMRVTSGPQLELRKAGRTACRRTRGDQHCPPLRGSSLLLS